MGNFRVVIDAVGGHGCQRDRTPGEPIFGCRSQTCPDCIVQECVEKLKAAHQNVNKAELIHWPDSPSEIRDTFVLPVLEVRSYKNTDGKDSHHVHTVPIHRLRDKKFSS